MTVTQRKPQPHPDEVHTAVNEPGDSYSCDSCSCDLTHAIRIKCADPICCSGEDGVDLCPMCFCSGKEFGNHKRSHAYRVIEFSSYPIFSEDWGADEELLLFKGILSQGIGNWKKIAEHIGTRTKEEVEKHYNEVYVDSPTWPVPKMDVEFDIDPSEFQERKRRRISLMNSKPIPPPKIAPVSLPAIHEISGYLPGRLEFEHEIENEAEDVVKDLEFGVCLEWGGDEIPEDENDTDVKARLRWENEKRNGITPGTIIHTEKSIPSRKTTGKGLSSKSNGKKVPKVLPTKGPLSNGVNGHPPDTIKTESSNDDVSISNGDEEGDEITQPPPTETKDSLQFKLTLLEMYAQRLEKRAEGKAAIINRGLLDYKKIQTNDKKRQREERETLHRIRPFARIQTAEDFEAYSADIIREAVLRKTIQDLQKGRRHGLQTAADIEKYELDLSKRTAKINSKDYYPEKGSHKVVNRQSQGPDARLGSHVPDDRKSEREETPRISGTSAPTGLDQIKRTGPLNLANSPSLHLLTPGEQTLCSTLRILPKPYLVIKETLVREYARRGGKLRRREARDLVKIDVNKTSRVWDFLVQAGFLKITTDPPASAPMPPSTADDNSQPSANGTSSVQPSVQPSLKPPPVLPTYVVPQTSGSS